MGLLRWLTPWHDEKETAMKVKKTDRVIEEAREQIQKTHTIVEQYRLAGVIIAQERRRGLKQ